MSDEEKEEIISNEEIVPKKITNQDIMTEIIKLVFNVSTLIFIGGGIYLILGTILFIVNITEINKFEIWKPLIIGLLLVAISVVGITQSNMMKRKYKLRF